VLQDLLTTFTLWIAVARVSGRGVSRCEVLLVEGLALGERAWAAATDVFAVLDHMRDDEV
jgi:hypothetical protein